MSPPPSDRRADPPLCAWCRDELGEVADEFNGAVGHPECARHAYEIIAGPDPMPWPRRRHYRDRDIVPFLERLGGEAARLGI